MIRSSRGVLPLRGLLVTVVAALVPVIAGCESGINAPTQQWHQPTPGASAAAGPVQISNMFVLGPVPGSSLAPGSSAGLFLALSDNGAPDRLLSITAPGVAASVQVPAGGISIGRQQLLLLTGPVPRLVLTNLTRALAGGQAIRMNMEFQSAGQVSLLVPVMPRASYFSTYSPPRLQPSPKPTITPVQGGSTPTPVATPSP